MSLRRVGLPAWNEEAAEGLVWLNRTMRIFRPEHWLAKSRRSLESGAHRPHFELGQGARVGVLGGGPAGSFFSCFFLDMAERAGLDAQVDLYEWKDFSVPGPGGCNMCGGVVSESLVQTLAAEGINLPSSVIAQAIDAYVLHTDSGVVRIQTPLQEMRIAAVYRGAGPRGTAANAHQSFDGFLLDLAAKKGARVVRERVQEVDCAEARPRVKRREGTWESYDLLVVAVGVNSPLLKAFEQVSFRYQPPKTTRTYISEFHFGEEILAQQFGHAMHVFLLHLPRLEFAALIPKGDFLTFCLLGENIDDALVNSFLESPVVRRCLPPNWRPPDKFCHCSPRMSIGPAAPAFADRVVFIGDCGVSRLYKDGIGSAYRLAKAAARTAIFDGVSGADFARHFAPLCRAIIRDNQVGKLIFLVTRQIQRWRVAQRGVLGMVGREQQQARVRPRLSMVLWDTFSGSASYADVFRRTLHPFFGSRLAWELCKGLRSARPT